MDAKDRTDVAIARLAARRHGVVSRQELLAAGVTRDEIRRRVARGSLICVHRGVFRVGHAAPSLRADYAAAVLACGEGALLFERAAAHLHRLLKDPPSVPAVLCPTERRVPGVMTRRSRKPLIRREVTIVSSIPVTTVPRTLVDLAAPLSLTDLASACHEAGIRYRTTPRHIARVLERHPKTSGIANLRLVVTGEEQVTLSRLERAFRRLLREHRLPRALTNRPAGGRRVDCRWPEHRLTVELDSFTFHNSRHSWQRDRQREREAYARGDEFRRYTWADVLEDPRAMLRELSGLLS
jgi:very-short-patch-repair endonuclease